MNAKLILFLSCFAAVTLAASGANADPRRGGDGRGGGHIRSMPPRSGATFSRGGTSGTFRNSMPPRGGATFSRGTSGTFRNWSGRNWSGDWRRNRFSNNQSIFIGGFGFPFFYGYPYYGYYPYDYGYGYDSGYNSYGYYSPYGYGNNYYSQPAYGYGDQGYGSGDQSYGYGNQGYGSGNQGYGSGDQGYGSGNQGYGSGDRSSIAQLQRRLARAGYYHGAIDGIMGPETRRAVRAYERSYGAPGMR